MRSGLLASGSLIRFPKMKLVARKYLLLFLFQLSYLIPKKKGLIAFWPYQDETKFGGNLKPVFLELIKRRGRGDVVWLTRNRKSALRMKRHGYRVFHGKFRLIFMLLRSHVIVLDTVYPIATGFPPFAWGRFHIVQLWHGTGFKEIGFRHAGAPNSPREIRSSAKQTVLVPASSEADRVRKSLSFATDNVVVTGSPRNDIFFAPEDHTQKSRGAIRMSLGIPPDSRVILYAPTFRDHQKALPFSEDFAEFADQVLARSSSYLVIKRHPLDHGFVPPVGHERIIDASETIDDTQDLLLASDVLVTDYSGIVTDFILLDRPVIFFLYDYEDYQRSCRDFYYDFLETVPGPIINNEKEMLRLAAETCWFHDADYRKRYKAFVTKFHKHRDGCSTQRVASIILNFVDGASERLDRPVCVKGAVGKQEAKTSRGERSG